ncbi:MAG: TRAP transporter TatT component family protein [Verrucomicrobia bacterium]|nr:TRAP transporter TatT component family protein [Verrucomicrobiota bacterium]
MNIRRLWIRGGIGCGAVAVALLNSGCSIERMAINRVGDALARGGSTFSSDNDPELIRQAVPFSLKLMESLLAENPRHEGLLLAAAQGYTQYAYAFLQLEADVVEEENFTLAERMRERARNLYLRARDYGVRGLEARHPGFGAMVRQHPQAAVQVGVARDVPLLYWTAAAWGSAIAVSKDVPDLIADQTVVGALIDRALELDEAFDDGAIHAFLITFEMARQGRPGDPEPRARRHFERALELAGGRKVDPLVTFAESVALPRQRRAEFEGLLRQALAVDPDACPEARLANVIQQHRARWLLARADDLFLQPASAQNPSSPGAAP